jgi:hypothetical protein
MGLLLGLALLVAAGVVLAVTGVLPSRAAPTGRAGAGSTPSGAPPPAGSPSTTAPPPSTTAPPTSTTAPPPSTTAPPPSTTAPPPSTTTTTTIPLTTLVPRPPVPPASVAATGVFASGALAAYLAGEAKASLDMTATAFDAAGGETSTYWPTLRLTAASSMKLDILEVLLEHAQHAGTALNAAQASLAQKMIEDSTNTAGQALWDTVGGAAAVGAYDGAAGLSETAPNEPGYWGLSTTGPSDLVRLMSDVAFANPLLDDASRAYALGLLTHVLPTQTWGATAGVPPGVSVAIKNGWLRIDGRWEVNTTAWVDGDGRDYVVAVMSWGDVTGSAGIHAVDGLCSLLWAAFAPA